MAIWKKSGQADRDEPPTRIRATPLPQDVENAVQPGAEPASAPPGATVDDEPETIDMDAESGFAPAAEPQTAIAAVGAPATASNAMEDPPAGILVVVDGPGKGEVVTFGYGANTIGRGAGQRVRLDFGDPKISRENHAQIIFDPKTRITTLRHETGANLSYVEGEAALSPLPLGPRARLQIGDTTLMLVPLCDEDFDWDDAS